MGTRFSFKRDYNRVLATQPRTSISVPKFELPNGYEQQISTHSFTIPVPLNIPPTKSQSNDIPSTPLNEHFKPTPTLLKSKPSSNVEEKNISTVINDKIRQKPKEEQPQKEIVAQNTTFPVQSDVSKHHQVMTDDPVVISRAVIHIDNNRRETKNHFSSSFHPTRTIVERNGHQFLVEFKERIEQRYVQYFDETTHKIRRFEVIDCIPYRIIRPYKNQPQSESRNDASQNIFLPTLPSNQRLTLPPIPDDQLFSQLDRSSNLNDRSKTVTPSKSVDNKKPSKHDMQYNKANMPSTNKTAQNIEYLFPRPLISPSPVPSLTAKQVVDSTYTYSQYSQPGSLQSLSPVPKNVPEQYSSETSLNKPPSFRAHTPTIFDDNATPSISDSSYSDEEIETNNNGLISQQLTSNENLSDYELMNQLFGNNRNSTTVSYKKNHRYASSKSLDPFARSLNSNDHHHYRKLPDMQNYAQPMMIKPKFRQPIHSDYSPIPPTIKQSNQNEYYYNNNSTETVYNG